MSSFEAGEKTPKRHRAIFTLIPSNQSENLIEKMGEISGGMRLPGKCTICTLQWKPSSGKW